MAEREADYGREVRETIVKSSLTGVAATVLAVALASPAGLGGMIGTSVASGSGASAADDNPYAVLPAYPTPLSADEVTQIRDQLVASAAALEISRSETEARVAFVRDVALRSDMRMVATFAPAAAAPAAAAPAEEEFAPIQAPVVTASFAAPLHDPHLELAALLLDERF